MVTIIARGTVNGYNTFPINSPFPDEDTLRDFRALLDNSNAMLLKSSGFAIQSSPDGVWISLSKLMMDGERPGGGEGFMSFSLYCPMNEHVPGTVVMQTLTQLMSQYTTSMTDGIHTKSIGVDWSFLETAASQVNSHITPRRPKSRYLVKEEQYAYLDIPENEVADYLDRPFMTEYGKYKMVFLGKHLIREDLLSTFANLSINLNDQEYDVVWNGNPSLWPGVNLPKAIRSTEIVSGTFKFERNNYNPVIVRYSDGKLEHDSLCMAIPEPVPITYTIYFEDTCNAIQNIEIRAKAVRTAVKNIRQTDKGLCVDFIGDEIEEDWHYVVTPIVGYQPKEDDFYPKINVYTPISIALAKTITYYVHVFDESGADRTQKYDSEGLTKSNKYDSTRKALCYNLPEGKDLLLQDILTDNARANYEAKIERKVGYVINITIKGKQKLPQVPVGGNNKGDWNQPHDEPSPFAKFWKKYKLIIILGIVIAVLVAGIILGWQKGWFKTIINKNEGENTELVGGQEIKQQIDQTEDSGNVPVQDTINKTSDGSKSPANKSADKKINDAVKAHHEDYETLNSYLNNKANTWKDKDWQNCKNNLKQPDGNYGEDTETRSLFNQFMWLSCRQCIDDCNTDRLKSYAWPDRYPDESIKNYTADKKKQDWIRMILNPKNADILAAFRDEIKNNPDAIKQKTFDDVKKIWEDCQKSQQLSPSSEQQTHSPANPEAGQRPEELEAV